MINLAGEVSPLPAAPAFYENTPLGWSGIDPAGGGLPTISSVNGPRDSALPRAGERQGRELVMFKQ